MKNSKIILTIKNFIKNRKRSYKKLLENLIKTFEKSEVTF